MEKKIWIKLCPCKTQHLKKKKRNFYQLMNFQGVRQHKHSLDSFTLMPRVSFLHPSLAVYDAFPFFHFLHASLTCS